MNNVILAEQKRQISLSEFQNTLNFALTNMFNGNHLANRGRIMRPIFKKINNTFFDSVLELGKIVYMNPDFKLKTSNDVYRTLADSVKFLRNNIDSVSPSLSATTIVINKKYKSEDYKEKRFRPINQMCDFIKKKLEPFIIDAYIHGSLSTMDFTGYSDLDTLFIIKQAVMEDFQKIKLLENLFLESLKYLYNFDPFQHHGHFYLIESELKYYNQSYLPISAIELSKCILGNGSTLTLHLRDCHEESRKRFIQSAGFVLRYCSDYSNKTIQPYQLKKFLSHLMILPVLFLQLNGMYVSKKESFKIIRSRIPEDIWQIMEFVSTLRQQWYQEGLVFDITRTVSKINHLLIPYSSKYLNRSSPFHFKIDQNELFRKARQFVDYLIFLGGIRRGELNKYSV